MPRDGAGLYTTPPGTTVTTGTVIASAPYNALHVDLAADANAVRPVVAGGTGGASAVAAQTALGLLPGTNVQAQSTRLQSVVTPVGVVGDMPYLSTLPSFSFAPTTAYGRAILNVATEAAFKALLNIEAGIDFQAFDADLASIAATSWVRGDVAVRDTTQVTRLGIGAANTVLTSNGTDPQWQQSFRCRAWGHSNGGATPVLTAGGNIASLTDSGVGIYDLAFTAVLPDAAYSVVSTALGSPARLMQTFSQTASGFQLRSISLTGTLIDADNFSFAVFR